MVVIGINAYHADASVALIRDGKLVLACEEERFTRRKHQGGFPMLALQYCLKEAKLRASDVDIWSIGRDPSAKRLHKIKLLASNPAGSIKALRSRVTNMRQVRNIEEDIAAATGVDMAGLSGKIQFIEHHLCHVASAYFHSPFEQAACLTIDGSGDFTTSMFASAEGADIKVLKTRDFPHSLGFFYTAFTQLLGFPNFGDEYKIMGLAPYGDPKYLDELRKIIMTESDKMFSLDTRYFVSPFANIISYDDTGMPVVHPLYSNELAQRFGIRKQSEALSQYHKDLAASVQAMTEEVIFHLANQLHKKYPSENLCYAGGVGQNSVANGKLLRNTPFSSLYIPVAAHDAGIAIGAALYSSSRFDQMRYPSFDPFLGAGADDNEIRTFLDDKNVKYTWMDGGELYDGVTNAIIKGDVVGWFQGRAEFGPRALGGRSILADPRRADAKDLINSKIKRRESFRPFAPSVLREYAHEFFDMDGESPFMEKVFPVKASVKDKIPAVTHVDGSARVQTVDEQTAPRYYQLIKNFYKKTGIPLLLNTSFNENEPIVNTPQEAFDCYVRTDLDMLVLGNCILVKQNHESLHHYTDK